jgi:hypothetical protein
MSSALLRRYDCPRALTTTNGIISMTSPTLVYADSTISTITAKGGLRGYLTASHAAIVAAFGPPNSTRIDPYKMDVEWLVQTPAGPAWIYNWKPELPPGVAVEDITSWHVGGQTADVVTHVAEALEASATALRQDPTTRRLVTERIDRVPGRQTHRPMTAAAATGSTVSDDLAEHLLTGEPLFVAGARPDHGEGRNQPFSFAPTQPIRLRPHPLNGEQTSVVAGRLCERTAPGPATWYVALAHLAHARGACAACESVWREADAAWAEIPAYADGAHAALFAAFGVETNAALLVHVDDVPADWNEQGTEAKTIL